MTVPQPVETLPIPFLLTCTDPFGRGCQAVLDCGEDPPYRPGRRTREERRAHDRIWAGRSGIILESDWYQPFGMSRTGVCASCRQRLRRHEAERPDLPDLPAGHVGWWHPGQTLRVSLGSHGASPNPIMTPGYWEVVTRDEATRREAAQRARYEAWLLEFARILGPLDRKTEAPPATTPPPYRPTVAGYRVGVAKRPKGKSFDATVPLLPGIRASGGSPETAVRHLEPLVRGYLAALKATGQPLPPTDATTEDDDDAR